MLREQKISLICVIALIGYLASVMFCYEHGLVHHEPYPTNTVVFPTEIQFRDFYDTLRFSSGPYDPPVKIANVYPPLQYIVMDALRPLGMKWALRLYLSAFCAGFAALCWRNVRVASRTQTLIYVAILTFCSFPVLTVLDRGNVEGFVFFLIYGFVLSVEADTSWKPDLFLALALNLKPFPLFLFPLYFRNRNWRGMIRASVMTGVIGIASTLFYGLNFGRTFMGWKRNFAAWNRLVTETNWGLYGSHSLFTAGRAALQELVPATRNGHTVRHLLFYYNGLTTVLFIALAYYVARIERTYWKQATLLIFAMNLFPFLSYDYKLVHVFVALYLFVNSRVSDARDVFYAVCFALLLVPVNEIPIHFWDPWITLGVFVHPALQLMIALTIIADGLRVARRTQAGTAVPVSVPVESAGA